MDASLLALVGKMQSIARKVNPKNVLEKLERTSKTTKRFLFNSETIFQNKLNSKKEEESCVIISSFIWQCIAK